MSIEAMTQAIEALNEAVAFREGGRQKAIDAINALRTAIQQAVAQQPVTGEPVQADSSEYLRVIASLGAALRRLSFAAQTTGGTTGPDAELQSAIGQAEQALSLGGIGQAMFATPEPVAWFEYSEQHKSWFLAYTRNPHVLTRPLVFGDTHPAPGVPDDSKRLDYLQERGATIDLIPGVADFYPMQFRVGGLHSSANTDVRAAIDAAMLAASQAQKGGAA